ncbi:21687_t:CDS:2, partial [Racocetra persica]
SSKSSLGKRRNFEDKENQLLDIHQNRFTTPPPCENNSFLESSYTVFDKGLTNYKDGMKIDLELVVQETDETAISYSECSFDYNSWKN